MKNIVVFLLILLMINSALAQSGFNAYNTSRFARAVGMANSYVGVAEGVETTFYNSAGLVYIDYYGLAYSYGNGSQFIVAADPYDIAITLPGFENIGSFAFSAHFLNYPDHYVSSSIYKLHYAGKISKYISLGGSINYFYQKYETYVSNQTFSSDAFDMSISGLFHYSNLIFSDDRDVFKIGFQFNNLLSSKIEPPEVVIIGAENNYLLQYLGIGISYKYIPSIESYIGFVPISVLFASDFIFDNGLHHNEYEFDRMNLNFGFEVKIMEMLALRFGRENEENLTDLEYKNLQVPVTRFGFGVNIPLHRFIKLENKMFIIFDYAFSEWDNQDEINRISHQFDSFFNGNGPSDKYAYSLQIRSNF